ncbi:MAG TPA: phage tail protein [Longimicrobiaceae bacterium]
MDLDVTRPGQASSYLDHLPAVFREGAAEGAPNFLGRFLLAFEHLLTGLGDPAEPGLDELLDRVPDYLDPDRAPTEFLDWLAGWVALTLRGDLDTAASVGSGDEARAARERRAMARTLIASAVPLYRLRGTRRGLEELIRLFTGGLSPTITEMTASLQIGVSSRIGEDTLLDGGAPHFFQVLLRLPQPNPEARRRFEELARAIIDVEKPAHTRYDLDVLTPAMQLGLHSQVGVDTLLVPAGT